MRAWSCCRLHTRHVHCCDVTTRATPRTGCPITMPDERPMSPTNWCDEIVWVFLPLWWTETDPFAMRKTELEGWPSSCSTEPLRSVTHVPASNSFENSTSETPCAAKLCRQTSTACSGSRSACLRSARMRKMWEELIRMKTAFQPNGSHSGWPTGWKKVKTSDAHPDATESTRRLRMSGSRKAVPASMNAAWPATSETDSLLPRSGTRKRCRRIASPNAARPSR